MSRCSSPARSAPVELQAVEEGAVSKSREELDGPELNRLEPAGRSQLGPEGQEVLRPHRLQDPDLGHQHLLDGAYPPEIVGGPVGVAGRHGGPGGVQLVQDLLEPQLVDLMDDDEEQLVVGSRLGALQSQQLGERQVAAVVEPPAFLAEAGTGWANRRTS